MAFSNRMLAKLNMSQDALEKKMIRDVKHVFTTVVGMEDLLYVPLAADPMSHFSDCLSGMVGLTGEYNGLTSIHVSKRLARMMTERMLDAMIRDEHDDIEDALGEIANIIAGSFKQHLMESGDLRITTPSVMDGKRYALHVTRKPEVTTMLFATDDDDWFMVALALEV